MFIFIMFIRCRYAARLTAVGNVFAVPFAGSGRKGVPISERTVSPVEATFFKDTLYIRNVYQNLKMEIKLCTLDNIVLKIGGLPIDICMILCIICYISKGDRNKKKRKMVGGTK